MGKAPHLGNLSNHRKCMVDGTLWELAVPLCGVNAAHEMWVVRPGSSCPCAGQQFLSLRNLVGMKIHETMAHASN